MARCQALCVLQETEFSDSLVSPVPPALELMQENALCDKPFGRLNRAIVKDQSYRSIFGTGGLWWRDDESALGGYRGEVGATTLSQVMGQNLDMPNLPDNAFMLS